MPPENWQDSLADLLTKVCRYLNGAGNGQVALV